MTLRSFHLFAGIGGAALGFQRAGIAPSAFSDIFPHAQAVLRRHWPEAQHFGDIRDIQGKDLEGPIHVITGGFPCQDISFAKRGAQGLHGERSRLWFEQLRLIDELKPAYVVAENSPALRSRGLEDLLRSLDEIGYDAEWHNIPASYLGAWHKRDRIWLLAYPRSLIGRQRLSEGPLLGQSDLSRPLEGGTPEWPGRSNIPAPSLCRTDDGVPERSHRLRGLGNSVYTPIPEMIGLARPIPEMIGLAIKENYERNLSN